MRNPISKMEMKLAVRTKKFPINLFVLTGILTIFTIFAFYMIFDASYNHYDAEYATYATYTNITILYVFIAVMEMALICFLVPAITAGTIAGEREKQTLEILLTSKLTCWQIVFGKLKASISTILLYIISSIPVMCIVFSIGGVAVTDVLQVLAYTVVLAIYVGSAGIMFSTIYKKTISATVLTYVFLFFITMGTFAIIYMRIYIGYLDGVREFGAWPLINLINPITSIVALIESQVGSGDMFEDLCLIPGAGSPFNELTPEVWFWISVVVQIVVAFICLCVASKRLNPIKKAKKNK